MFSVALQGLKVLVAGATGGVGKAVVQQLAAQVRAGVHGQRFRGMALPTPDVQGDCILT